MAFNFPQARKYMGLLATRWFWSTPQRRWTTGFVVAGFALATVVRPAFGIAVFGTAFAGWWLAVLILTLVSGLLGNRIGVERERRTKLR